jgi:hypothetical protein
LELNLIGSLTKANKEGKAVWNFIDKSWVQIKIAFDVRDGFRRTGKTFELPEDIHSLSPDRKQLMTLCNLFANHGQSIEELAVYFDMDRNRVIALLMLEGLLKDQRRRSVGRIKSGRRESDCALSQTVKSDALQDGLGVKEAESPLGQ